MIECLLKRVRAGTGCAIGEVQCWFRQGGGCMNQEFAVRQVCEKYRANGKDVSWAFVDLEKTYDTIDRQGIWQMLREYGVGGKLLKAVQSLGGVFSGELVGVCPTGMDVSDFRLMSD